MTAELAHLPGTSVPSIYECMARVAEEIGAVQKNLKNVESGYAARGIDDVLNAVHGPLTNNRVTVAPKVLSAEYEVVHVGRNQTPMRQATLRIRFRFYGPQGDHIDVVTCGEALDSGDKATNKAMSAALKYALLHTFTIPLVGDDADASSPQRSAVVMASKRDIDAFKAELEAASPEARDGFLSWKNDQGFPFPWPQAVLDAMRVKFEEIVSSEPGLPAAAFRDAGEASGDTTVPVTEPDTASLDDVPAGTDSGLPADPPGPRGYDNWPNADLLAECEERQMGVGKSWPKARLVGALRAWDDTYNPGCVEDDERPF